MLRRRSPLFPVHRFSSRGRRMMAVAVLPMGALLVGCGVESINEDLATDTSAPSLTFNMLAGLQDSSTSASSVSSGTRQTSTDNEQAVEAARDEARDDVGEDSLGGASESAAGSEAESGSQAQQGTESASERAPDRGRSEGRTRFESTTTVEVISACHEGEVDILRKRLQLEADYAACTQVWHEGTSRLANAPPDYSKARLSLESEFGDVLGGSWIDVASFYEAGRSGRSGARQAFGVELPFLLENALLAQGSTFRVSLFVCSDSDGDGACSDEQVAQLPPALESQSHCGASLATQLRRVPSVVYYQPFEVRLAEGSFTFTPLDPSDLENPDGFAQAAIAMNHTLRNYAPVDLQSLSAALVGRVERDPACEPQPRTNGCFVEGTMIATSSNRVVPVESLTAGSVVRTHRGRNAVVQRVVAGPESHPVVAIVTSTGDRLVVTQDHPIVTSEGLRRADELVPEDHLLTAGGTFVGVASLNSLDYFGKVWNFVLDGSSLVDDHLVVSGSLVTGDLTLQNHLKTPQVALR
ncbi:MAG: hypothetical protein IPK13_08710 [Deltaproteobacteria bacterium]|nr:hypothetical protein [Deltaproteobacteria bacterium]